MSDNTKQLPGTENERKELYRDLVFLSGGDNAKEKIRTECDNVMQGVVEMFREAFDLLIEAHGKGNTLIINFVKKQDDGTYYFSNKKTRLMLSLKPVLNHPFIEIMTRTLPERGEGSVDDWKSFTPGNVNWPLYVAGGQLTYKDPRYANICHSVFMFIVEILSR